MLELLQSDLAAGVPRVKDSGFIGDVFEKICAGKGGSSFGSDQLQLFMLETLGLPEEDLRGIKMIVREVARGADEVTAENLGGWWHDTALTVGAASTMGPADDFRRGLRLLGLFGTARDALLSNLRDSAEEPEPEAEIEALDQKELKELFQRCDTGRSKHLQIFDIARVALDLGLLLTKEELKAVLRELDMSNSNRVGFIEFKAWWEADAERSWFATAGLRRRLRLCGLLMSTSRSVLDVFQLGMDISDDENLAELVDDALDIVMQKGTRNQVREEAACCLRLIYMLAIDRPCCLLLANLLLAACGWLLAAFQ